MFATEKMDWVEVFGNDPFHVIDYLGLDYVTNRFWISPMPADLEDVFEWWRLPIEPGTYKFVDGRLIDIPSVDKSLSATSLLKECTDVTRRVYPVLVKTRLAYVEILSQDGPRLHNVFTELTQGEGKHITARADYLELAFGPDWHLKPVYQKTRSAPLIYKDPFALVMPLREE